MATSSSLSSSIAIALLVICFCGPAGLAANPSKGPICDVTADHYLALEDYTVAIHLHREFLQKHAANALAHYHLGFAYGMTGDEMQELDEYQHAIALGLSRWDLFLNTGVALLASGNLPAAMGALQRAVQLDPSQPEYHYNVGLENGSQSLAQAFAFPASGKRVALVLHEKRGTRRRLLEYPRL